MSDIYKDGVEVLCPAVYISNSAAEAIERVAIQLNDECNRLNDLCDKTYAAASQAEDAYGDSRPTKSLNYFSLLDEEEDED